MTLPVAQVRGAGQGHSGAARTGLAVDLSLPTDQQLMAAATPNPQLEAGRLTDGGDPARIAQLGYELGDIGAALDAAYDLSERTQRRLAAGFGNDGAPVYEEATHRAALPPGFPDAGTELFAVGRRLVIAAEELRLATDDVTASVGELLTDLRHRRWAWAAEVDAARGPDGLIPAPAVPGLRHRQARIALDMQRTVDGYGRAISDRIARYDGVLGDCTRLLSELGHVGSGGTDRSSLRSAPVLAGGAAPTVPDPGQPDILITPPAAGGPQIQVLPQPPADVRLEGGTGTAPAPVGPKVEINVPAAPADPRTDQGQYLPVGPGVHVDASRRRPGSGRVPSIGQAQEEVRKGRAPAGIRRFDRGDPQLHEKPHVHLNDGKDGTKKGGALNQDGTWKHGPERTLSGSEKDFLRRYGWTIPE